MDHPTSFGASMEPPSARLVPPRAGEKDQVDAEPDDHALGRSRGGWGSKIHILCDGKGNPLHFQVSAGQTHDSSMLADVLVGADTELHDEHGVAKAWPVRLGADKGYRANWIDEYVLELGIQPVIPCKANEDRSKRAVSFDKAAYRRRSIVECLIGWLKESRRIATRYEKTAINFCGMVKLALVHRYLRLCAP